MAPETVKNATHESAGPFEEAKVHREIQVVRDDPGIVGRRERSHHHSYCRLM